MQTQPKIAKDAGIGDPPRIVMGFLLVYVAIALFALIR